MTPAKRAEARQKQFASSMAGLVADMRFGDFIEIVREQRESAMESLADGNVIRSERSTLACIGEIAAYKSIISLYDEAVARTQAASDESTAD